MSERKQFFGLRYPDTKPIYFDRMGSEFQTSGLIIRGKDGATIFLYLPGEEPPAPSEIVNHQTLGIVEWVSVLKALDDPEIHIQDESGATKAIVRKSQRMIGAALQWEVYRRDNYTCVYCNRNDVPLTVDHYLPVELGGDDTRENLKSCCRACNKRKGGQHPDEWEKKLKSI